MGEEEEKVNAPLDAAALVRVREAVKSIESGEKAGVVALLSATPDAKMTVDFEATKHLGHPLVVVEAQRPLPPWWELLSPREQEVCAALRAGKRNQEIAGALFISVATVKDHVHNILGKASLKSRAEIVAAFQPAP